jgi:hypothetical protein
MRKERGNWDRHSAAGCGDGAEQAICRERGVKKVQGGRDRAGTISRDCWAYSRDWVNTRLGRMREEGGSITVRCRPDEARCAIQCSQKASPSMSRSRGPRCNDRAYDTLQRVGASGVAAGIRWLGEVERKGRSRRVGPRPRCLMSLYVGTGITHRMLQSCVGRASQSRVTPRRSEGSVLQG